MSVSEANLQLQYKLALQDKAALVEEVGTGAQVRDNAIVEAIRQYELRIPQIKTVLVSTAAAGFYAVPADWQTFSRIVTIEYPLDQLPPSYLRRRDAKLQRRDTGLFYYCIPNPGGSFRLTYTTKHAAVSGGNYTTIEARHEAALGKMAAAIALDELASYYAKTVQSSNDVVNYRTKEQEIRAVAKEIRAQIEREISTDELKQMADTDSDALSKDWGF